MRPASVAFTLFTAMFAGLAAAQPVGSLLAPPAVSVPPPLPDANVEPPAPANVVTETPMASPAPPPPAAAIGKGPETSGSEPRRQPSARLPEPDLPPGSAPADFLRAAHGAIAAGRIGEAQVALEMAQTRLLSRTVEVGQERLPSDDLAVKQISEAIAALRNGDRMSALRYTEFASTTLGRPLN